MKLRVKKIGFETGKIKDVIINVEDAKKLGRKAGDRVVLKDKQSNSLDKKYKVAILQISYSDSVVAPGEIGIFIDSMKNIEEIEGRVLTVRPAEPPDSFIFIKKKINGNKLTGDEINSIISDATSGLLSPIEIAAFITGVLINQMDNEEMTALTHAEARSGNIFDFGPQVYDKHSTGGVPGNKVSLIIVPIVAAAGLTIPKTSTRAITSPSGTADSMEVLTPVAFESEELKKIVAQHKACIVWGGALDISPADNVLIEIERPLHMDPVGLMIPSILTKKLSMGVKQLVLDIPVGSGTKFPSPHDGKEFAHVFKHIARNVGIEAECALTLAHQPIGHCIGPAIEAKEALTLLRDYNVGPNSLIEKSTVLAGILLEMGGKARVGKGQVLAKEILRTGRAYTKMKEIISAQGGNPDITPEEIKLGPHSEDFMSIKSGHITEVDNAIINSIAKAAGCPHSKGAGVEIFKKQGAKIEEGDLIFRVYSESQSKLKKAIKIYNSTGGPIILGGMMIERI
ncbi:MAG: AMP phosphorylase [Candidatus Lokiarchaeota archaeon]|nr:AMP phosphorylase [Candidatus Lokiarchaeota archaeon]MBD3341923.1 AMP phosphorylase [Candidatus Lokiarchaeota archaeon]